MCMHSYRVCFKAFNSVEVTQKCLLSRRFKLTPLDVCAAGLVWSLWIINTYSLPRVCGFQTFGRRRGIAVTTTATVSLAAKSTRFQSPFKRAISCIIHQLRPHCVRAPLLAHHRGLTSFKPRQNMWNDRTSAHEHIQSRMCMCAYTTNDARRSADVETHARKSYTPVNTKRVRQRRCGALVFGVGNDDVRTGWCLDWVVLGFGFHVHKCVQICVILKVFDTHPHAHKH